MQRPEVLNIRHDSDRHRFHLVINDHQDAELVYRFRDLKAGKAMDFVRTYVPPASRNKGIGEELVNHGVAYARENNYKIIPTCSFVQAYLDKRPGLKDLIATE